MSRKSPPRISRCRGTSPGVPFPYSACRRRESTSAPVARLGSRFCRDVRQRVPAAGYGAAHRFSRPLSDFLPLPTTPPFSGGWRSWGSLFRGLIPTRSSDDSPPPVCPLDVSPASRAPPILGRGIRRRDGRRLGCSGRLLDRLQGFPPRVNRSAPRPHFHDAETDLPLLSFCLPMVSLR